MAFSNYRKKKGGFKKKGSYASKMKLYKSLGTK